jgi:hypothetical protein
VGSWPAPWPSSFGGDGEVWHLRWRGPPGGISVLHPGGDQVMPRLPVSPPAANALMNLSQSLTWVLGQPCRASSSPPAIRVGVRDRWRQLRHQRHLLLALSLPRLVVAPRTSFLADLAGGLQEVMSRGWLRAGLVVFALSNMANAGFQVLGPVIIDRVLGGAASWGFILTFGALGAVVGGAIGLRWKPARPLLASFAICVLISFNVLALIPPAAVPVLAIVNFGAILAVILGNTLWDTTVQQHVPQEALSRVNSYDWMVSLIFQPSRSRSSGPWPLAMGRTDAPLAFLVSRTNVAVLAVPSVRTLRRRDHPESEPTAADVGPAIS